MRAWLDAIAASVEQHAVRTIVDVGCGTGRFSAALADRFAAEIIAVDPSRSMLAKAMQSVRHPRVRFLSGAGEQLPVPDASADLLFLSMVYHHLADAGAAALEFFRVLRPRGFVCIRNSTRDLLDHVLYLDYFPAAAQVNRNRLPSKDAVIRTMTAAGLSLHSHCVIEHLFAETHAEYCDKIARRALSDLIAIPDREFEAGLRAMREALRGRPGPVREPIDLFVFYRPAP